MHCFRLILSVMILMVHLAQAETIYTWVDAKGLVHFSNMPQSRADKPITLPELNIAAPPDLKVDIKSPSPFSLSREPLSVIHATITQPTNESVLRSNNGALTVHAELSRPLEEGEQLQLLINQTQYQLPTTDLEWQLMHLDRGQNSLSIQVLRDGKLIALSQPITVHILRVSQNSVKR